MPRDSSGTYTAPVNDWNPPVNGAIIDPVGWVAQLADYVNTFTDSMSRSGNGGMLANLELDSNAILAHEISTPSTPAANTILIYAVDVAGTSALAYKDSVGTETVLSQSNVTAGITFIIDGGGSAISTGIKGDLVIPFGATITQWTLLGDQSGSIVVDIWKDTYANYPPIVADTITAAAKPTISATTKGQSSTLTAWTTSITAGDTLRFNVDSITTLTRVTLMLKVTRT